MGCTKNPRLDRGPKLNSAIAQPQIMITNGVRQPGAWVVCRLPSAAAMRIPSPRLREPINAFAWKRQPACSAKCPLQYSDANQPGLTTVIRGLDPRIHRRHSGARAKESEPGIQNIARCWIPGLR